MRNAYKSLVRKPERKRLFRRSRHRKVWTGFIWLRWGIYELGERLLASQEEVCSMELRVSSQFCLKVLLAFYVEHGNK
jgi:hypothetical protein